MHEAAFSNDTERRSECRGIVKWLDEVLSGAMDARHRAEAKAMLNRSDDDAVSDAGYMEADGLPYEVDA